MKTACPQTQMKNILAEKIVQNKFISKTITLGRVFVVFTSLVGAGIYVSSSTFPSNKTIARRCGNVQAVHSLKI